MPFSLCLRASHAEFIQVGSSLARATSVPNENRKNPRQFQRTRGGIGEELRNLRRKGSQLAQTAATATNQSSHPYS